MKTNVVSGFSSSGWWLCLWAGFIGSAIKFSGLGERVAYWILVKMGKTELMANYATSIANTVLSLMIPSNTARGAVMSPICDNICEGMGYKRGEHKGDAAMPQPERRSDTPGSAGQSTSGSPTQKRSGRLCPAPQAP